MILGITASHGLGARAGGDYESIQTVTVGAGGQSSISFTSIPSTYKHLQIRINAKSTGVEDTILARFNSDSTYTNYFGRHILYGDGGSAGAAANNSSPWSGAMTGFLAQSTSANVFSAGICDILDYANTNKNKVTRVLTGNDYNGSGYVALASGLWMNTAAISSITLITYGGSNFAQYSSFGLYGIKG